MHRKFKPVLTTITKILSPTSNQASSFGSFDTTSKLLDHLTNWITTGLVLAQ
jgi:hypothetical protein